jgi:murein DD-endopeptidase MepM/ murein hydrolase activator NlpD
MGSTGHSTGPHVHFEVLHNGRQVDPLSFIGR